MKDKLIEYSKQLRLGKEFLQEYQDIPFVSKEDYLARILEIAVNYRKINAKNRLLKQAKFDVFKTFEDYDFSEVDFPETIGSQELKELSFILRQ